MRFSQMTAIAAGLLMVAGGTAATGASAGDDFVGKWANVDDKTRGLTRIEIATKDKGWTIQAWGRAGAWEPDLGKVTLSLLGDSVEATEMKFGFASWDHKFVDMHITLQLEKDRLIVERFDIFKDNSGRSNARSRYEFKKTRAADQSEAVAAITKLGGKVEVDEDSPGKPVVTVDLSNSKVTNDDLKHLEKLTGLRSLTLSHITDAGMEHLKDLTDLQSLTIHSARITDKGLKSLKRMKQLQSLYFSCLYDKDNVVGFPLTDKGLEELKGLTALQTLKLNKAGRFSDQGIEELQKALPKTRIIIH